MKLTMKFKVSTRTENKEGIEVTLNVASTAVGARQAAGLIASRTARQTGTGTVGFVGNDLHKRKKIPR